MTASDASRPVTVRCPHCGQWNRIDLARLALGPRCGACRTPILLDRPLKVSGSDFDRTVESAAVPVVTDFYADWCGPCRIMAPVLDQLAGEQAGRVLVLKVDTDRDPELSNRFGIRGIPTIIVFRSGREAGRHVGVATRADLDRLVGNAGAR